MNLLVAAHFLKSCSLTGNFLLHIKFRAILRFH